MITNAILKLIGGFFSVIIGLLPSFDFLDGLLNAKENFINFISEFMSYTLYVFNVPVLRFTFGLLVAYFSFLAVEYGVKLVVKYVTRLL